MAADGTAGGAAEECCGIMRAIFCARWRVGKRFARGLAAGVFFFCVAGHAGVGRAQSGGGSSADEEAREQVGKYSQNQIPRAMPGPNHPLADTKRALATADSIFAAYVHVPLLDPPRGFEMMHNENADARNTPRGWPIPVSSGFILLAYDSSHRLPNGRFATIGEGPVLGGFSMNSIDCDNPSAEKDLGQDEISDFYLMPAPTATMGGWPETNGQVFITKRTQPRWLAVTAERVLKV